MKIYTIVIEAGKDGDATYVKAIQLPKLPSNVKEFLIEHLLERETILGARIHLK